jgi:hypothetical protein
VNGRNKKKKKKGYCWFERKEFEGRRKKNDDLRMTLCKHIAVNFFFVAMRKKETSELK